MNLLELLRDLMSPAQADHVLAGVTGKGTVGAQGAVLHIVIYQPSDPHDRGKAYVQGVYTDRGDALEAMANGPVPGKAWVEEGELQ